MVVYLVTNLINGKHYVGKTVQLLKDRWAKHLSKARRGSRTYLHSAIRKYGPDASSIVPLVSILTTDPQLKEFERLWIRLLRSNERQFGYNLTAGGEGNLDWNPSTETRRNMSEGQTGRTHPQEIRRKISDSLKGNSYRKGIPHSPEIRRKISDSQRGKKRPAETRRRISAAVSVTKFLMTVAWG